MRKHIKSFHIGFVVALGLSIISGDHSRADTAGSAHHSSLFDRVSLRYTGVVQGTSFPYYSRAERIQTITDLIQSIQSDYSLLLYKQHTLGVDIVAIGQAAVAAERSIPDTTSEITQAQGNMQFLDRVRKITANFQDSHFQLDAVDPLSPVSLGFIVSNISGKYLVTSLRPKYLANQDVSIGDEVVSIDGKDPLTAANELKPYFPASSDLYRTNSAVFCLTSRDFALPTQPTASVVLKRNGVTVSRNLPWGAASITRSDQATYLKNIQVPPAMQNLGFDTESLFSEDWRTNIDALKNRIDFADVSNPTTPVITVGTLDSASGPVAYLQIQTFMITAVSQIPGADDPAQGSAVSNILTTLENSAVKGLPNFPFVRTIKKMLSKEKPLLPTNVGKVYKFSDFIDIVMAAFKAQSMPLILDIRYNPGGIIADAISLIGDLASHNENIAPLSQMFRVTNLAWESVDAAVARGTQDPANLDPPAQEVAAIFTEARAKGSDYSEVLPANPLTTNNVVNGYNQKIVVLTSSLCVSACDVTALLLKNSGRATLMGEPTNGTGAGFFSTFEVPDFTDTNHIIVAHLPNSLFGRPLRSDEDPKTVAVESIEAENHPTQPDVLVEPTLRDVQNGNSDLITAAIAKVTAK